MCLCICKYIFDGKNFILKYIKFSLVQIKSSVDEKNQAKTENLDSFYNPSELI